MGLVYCLEPAGSHGVWGLDDYHFLPFIFGSSQLIGHKYMKPKSIHNDDIVENFSKEYLYISGIEFIKKVKKGPFSEHSPLLDDISGVPNWNKVNSGLLKMYKAEVLEKGVECRVRSTGASGVEEEVNFVSGKPLTIRSNV
ncbi:phosphotyrosyl phosphatase activator family protein [Prunus dulcis]|uniref:Serine/threonine-protein phosphatase 2A activator n=1 Tax=Prunus dulcis TaxID=3755 RepID=A0A4Y1QV83_PRUDU|nr:phosphotyrosyl phosphatase activator family protein [Prunus dulcis]